MVSGLLLPVLPALQQIAIAFAKCDKQHGVLPTTPNKSRAIVRAVGLVTLLFFNWGFTYGMLDVMNSHCRQALDLTGPQGAMLAVAYYAAYFGGPLLISGPMTSKCGYRVTFIFGLFLVAVGAFCFAFSARLRNKEMLALAMHVSGQGVASLERAANPYVVHCGPKKSSAQRILFSQSVCCIGTVVAALAAKVALYGGPDVVASGAHLDLDKTIVLYNMIGFITLGLVVIFGLIFFRTTWVPELPIEQSPPWTCGWKVWKHDLVSKKYLRLWIGGACNFFNMACQVTVAQFFMDYTEGPGGQTKAMATIYLSVAQTLFVAGRLTAFGLVLLPRVRPRHVLLVYITGAFATVLTCVFVSGKTAIAVACLIMLFEAPSFPMIFDQAAGGLGPWTATGESIMITSITGGGFGAPLFGLLKDTKHIGVSKAWFLIALFFAFVAVFAVMCNLVPSWRKAVDLEIENTSDAEMQLTRLPRKKVEIGKSEALAEDESKASIETGQAKALV